MAPAVGRVRQSRAGSGVGVQVGEGRPDVLTQMPRTTSSSRHRVIVVHVILPHEMVLELVYGAEGDCVPSAL